MYVKIFTMYVKVLGCPSAFRAKLIYHVGIEMIQNLF